MKVTRTYLELRSRAALDSVPRTPGDVRLERVQDCPASFYRYLYAEVGRACRWTDRLGWDDARIREHLARPEVSLYLLTVAAAPAGFFELAQDAEGSVEIAYFGLLPEYHGRGLGKWLLVVAAETALAAGPRVWLHTCTFDDPAALPNYLARGFRAFRSEAYEIADSPA